jgi:cytochrome bd-type quinol oxidase subunit 2
MTNDMTQDNGRRLRPGAVAAGGVLLTLGVLLLLDTTGTVRIEAGRLIAPMVLIAMGATILLEGGFTPNAEGKRRSFSTTGAWLVGIGVWMLVSQTHLFGLSYRTSWPLLLIMAGLMTAIRGMR